MLSIVVFSKDRPAQLELLLRSLRTHLADWPTVAVDVLYRWTDEDAGAGYELVTALHPTVRWHVQDESQAFKTQLLGLLDRSSVLTAFLVDDDVLKAPVSLLDDELNQLLRDAGLLCVSLRMGPEMDYCYSEDMRTPPPAFETGHMWSWPGLPGDWGYPMSLDGHVFRTADVAPLLELHDYHDPNSLEAALAAAPPARPRMRCYPSARLVNIPANRVQETARNRHAGVPTGEITARFLAGEQISLATAEGISTPAPHHELPFVWEPRDDLPAPALSPWAASGRPLRIGLLCIATSDYLPWAVRMIDSAQRHLLVEHEIYPFVFSDGHLGSERLGFPNATLYRYNVFAEHREWLERMDYLFYCDSDMLFVDTVGEEILGRLTGTQHPGYVGIRGPYEDRPQSTACIAPHEGAHYFYGGFNGGEAAAFLDLAEEIAERTDRDDAAGVMAVWHDESHLNRYFVDHPPEVVLSPSYAYPEVLHSVYTELWQEEYVQRIVALDKNHGRFRLERVASTRLVHQLQRDAA